MNNKQILENAPDGATHVDVDKHYWHNSSAFYWLCCDDGSTWAGYVGNGVRSLSDIREIEALRAEVVELKRDLVTAEKVVLSCDMSREKGEIRDLEQQAKCLEVLAESMLFRGHLENTIQISDVLEKADDLRNQARQLKGEEK